MVILLRRGKIKTLVTISIILCLAIFCTPVLSVTIYVDADAPGINNGASWANACTDMQSALSAAGTGDEIRVAQGTYKPTAGASRTVSFQLKNNVKLYGGYAGFGEPDPDARDIELYETILSADIGTPNDSSDNSYHVFYHPAGTNLDATAILNGFTITAGNADGSIDNHNGGGMFNEDSSPTVTNCNFTANAADSYGGGIFNDSSSPVVANCTFTDNTATFGGGGIFNDNSSDPTVSNCAFTDNTVSFNGGGIYNDEYSNPNVIDCTFTGNSGGGIYNRESSSSLVANCSFTGNSPYGMFNQASSSPTVSNCIFTGNGSYGIKNYDSASPAVTNCTFTGHVSSAMSNSSSSPVVTNCTFTDNRGSGIENTSTSTPTITNCIIWNNFGSQVINLGGAVPIVTYCNVQGGYAGTGNIDQDPLFANPGADDYNLQFNSPCIDAGDDSSVPPGITTDIEGGGRICNAAVDMGAHEQNIVFVDQDAPGNNSGVDWYNAYNDLQQALMMAWYGDQIRIAGGTYKPGTARTDAFQLLNTVGLHGGYAGYGQPDPDAYDVQLYQTILSADIGTAGNNSDNCYHVFYHPSGTDLDSSAVLDGVTITAGNANGPSPDCHGGGMYNFSSSPTVTNCTFTDNTAGTYGGAMYNCAVSSPIVTSCTFITNTATYAGAMYNSASNPTVIDCEFTGNTAENYGGAIFNFAASIPIVINSIFIDNSAARGGGIYNNSSASTVLSSKFMHNAAENSGGGIYNSMSDSTITNCIFSANSADNTGGAIYNYSASPTVTNAAFSYNTAEGACGGIYNYGSSSPVITNCILWNNTDPQIDNDNGYGFPVVTYSNIDQDYPGTGNIKAYPYFADFNGPDNVIGTEDDNLRLRYDSPCIDAGNNFAYPAGIMPDCDMMPRTVDDPKTVDTGQSLPSFPVIDMGAYEYQGITLEGDIDGDGDVDLTDFALMANNWLVGTN